MALASGTRLGPYAITAEIGVGGMGEVLCAISSAACSRVSLVRDPRDDDERRECRKKHYIEIRCNRGEPHCRERDNENGREAAERDEDRSGNRRV